MADAKISALTNLTAADAINDMIPIVDVSDTPPASGNTKRISINNILSSSPTASGALTVTGLVTAGSATITGDLTVDTSTLKVDSTNNRVGIGTATPGVRVDILSDNNTSLAAVLRVNSNNAAVSTSIAYDGVVASNGLTLQAGTSSSVIFNTNGANEAGRINTTGVYVLKGGLTTANGVGVAFPSTQVASSDANTLDDYEEGTFVPTVGGSISNGTATYGTRTGVYTKIGRIVQIQILVTWSDGTATGTQTVLGLPFAAHGTANNFSILNTYPIDIALTAGHLATSSIPPNGSVINLYQLPTGGGSDLNVPCDPVGTLLFTGTYTAA